MIKSRRLRSSKTPTSRPAGAAHGHVLRHRLFPGLVALWFAALFGLGSLAASANALGALVVHLHLPAILAAAAPPLGLTARLVLAIVLAGLGGAIGLLIGLVLHARAGGALLHRPTRPAETPAPREEPATVHDNAPRVRSRDAHPDAPPRRPLVVTEDVLPYPTSMVEPALAPQVDRPAGDADHRFDAAPEAHDLPPFLAAAMSAVQHERDQAAIFVGPAEPIIVLAEREVAAPAVAEPAMPEPVISAPGNSEPVMPDPVIDETPAATAVPPPLASQAAAAPKVGLAELPLASLGLVQLIERLALAIATRGALRAAQPPENVDPSMPLHRFDPLTMDPTGPLLRAKKTRGTMSDDATEEPGDDNERHRTELPAQLHDPLAHVGQWADDHADEALPPRFLGQPLATLAPDESHDADEPEAAIEHRYSSLADMALPRPELLGAESVGLVGVAGNAAGAAALPACDPVVPFPSRLAAGDAPAHPQASNDADRALREALATLRQMSAQR